MARVAERLVRRFSERCHAGLDAPSLQTEFLDTLQRIVPFDAAFCATVDPATLLFTGAVLHEIPPEARPRFLATSSSKTTSTTSGRSPRRDHLWTRLIASPGTIE